jgi:hypothetical protein
MKHAKILGLLAMTATVVMAFASAASATTLTDQTNAKDPYGVGKEIHAVLGAGGFVLNGVVPVTCHSATYNAEITDAGSATTTVKAKLKTTTISECTEGNHITVTKPGEFEIHTDTAVNDGNGTATWNAGAMTLQVTSLGLTCEFTGEATDVGTIDGSRKTDANKKHPTATVTTDVVIPRTGGSFFCGSSAELEVDWTITTPDYLDVD